MVHKLEKPATTTYWIAFGPGVVHSGKTEPNQVTETGLDKFYSHTNPISLLRMLSGGEKGCIPKLSKGMSVDEVCIDKAEAGLILEDNFLINETGEQYEVNIDPVPDPVADLSPG